MNRQDAALVPLDQVSEEGGRFWLSVAGARGRTALAAPSPSSKPAPTPQQPAAQAFAAQAKTKKLADSAAKFCTTLERFRLTCQPTIFVGRHLALD